MLEAQEVGKAVVCWGVDVGVECINDREHK